MGMGQITERISDFWAFNAESIALTVVVAVVFVLAHEATQWVVGRIKGRSGK